VAVLTRLKELRIAGNRLKQLEGLEPLANLVRLDAHNNLIGELSSLRVLSFNKHLTSVDFKGNPVHKVTGFRRLLLSILPHLAHLDAINTSSRANLFSDLDLSAMTVVSPPNPPFSPSSATALSPTASASSSSSFMLGGGCSSHTNSHKRIASAEDEIALSSAAAAESSDMIDMLNANASLQNPPPVCAFSLTNLFIIDIFLSYFSLVYHLAAVQGASRFGCAGRRNCSSSTRP
jgi:hypothetical protein